MSEEEVRSLSNQAEKILDGHTKPGIESRDWIPEAAVEVAAVLAELAKAHAIVELANAIRESSFGRNA